MHNLALELHQQGHIVEGSDDEIYEPSRSRLANKGLLPESQGWDPERLNRRIDAVILGKHARSDNPELLRALELNLPVFSFPEFVSRHCQASKRIVVAGSHGKTTTTSMIMHVLSKLGFKFDYLVGTIVDGFDRMVRLEGHEIMVVEGDEYPSSAIDDRAKMLHYNPTHLVLTGLAWDHINIYPTVESYRRPFIKLLNEMEADEICYFDQSDPDLIDFILSTPADVKREGYLPFETNRYGELRSGQQNYKLHIFGMHNMKNLGAAFRICSDLGIEPGGFLQAMSTYRGSARRLEQLYEDERRVVIRDFAHAPSKVKASVLAVRDRFPNDFLFCVLELHTFSSLDPTYIPLYDGTLDGADKALVYFDNEAIQIKKMKALDPDFVHKQFQHHNLQVINNRDALKKNLMTLPSKKRNIFLVMSSGHLGGFDLMQLKSAE